MDVPQTPPNPTDVVIGNVRLSAADAVRRVNGAAHWFWWIAGLSLVNSIASMFGGSFVMVMGLGIGQVVDAVFAHVLSGGQGGTALSVGFHLLMSAVIAGVFVAIGVVAKRPSLTAFVLGMALYAVDGLFLAVIGDWMSAGFHALALFFIWSGVVVLRAMRAQGGIAAARDL